MGGWGALRGRETRPRKDLDILAALADLPRLRSLFTERGFTTAQGFIAGEPITCVAPTTQIAMRTGYPLPEAYLHDLALLRAMEDTPARVIQRGVHRASARRATQIRKRRARGAWR
jgi:hypothetical protein